MMWKILTAQIREEIYFLLYAADCFQKNRKDANGEQKEQLIYCISSKRAKRGGKI